MKLGFFLTIWLIQVWNSESSETFQTDMREVYDRISEEMLLALKRSLSIPQSRHKRELQPGKQSLIDDSGVDRLIGVIPVTKLCSPAIRMLFIDVGNDTYAVCLTENEVLVGLYKEHEWFQTPYKRVVYNPVDVAAFHFKSHLYVLVTENYRGDEEGTPLWKINLNTGNAGAESNAYSNYPTSIAVWKMKINGNPMYNMAIANYAGKGDPYTDADFGYKVTVYTWKETYFDPTMNLTAHDVKDIEPFHIHGFAYIAIANFKRDGNNPQVDSEIFRYDLDKNTWISYQKIKTYGAMDWEFFTLGTSLGREFFLAVANNDGAPETRSMIYKFVEDKFLPFQCLQTTRATSIAVFSEGSTFVLAVANENDAVNLYQYDGWRFVPSIQSTTGAMSDGVGHLNFHRVVRNSENPVVLAVCNPKRPEYMSIFEMEFRHENLLENWHSNSTDWCLKVLSSIEKSDLEGSIGSFDDVIFRDQSTVTIDGNLVFENGFEAETLKTPKLTEKSTKEEYDDNLLVKLGQLATRLKDVKTKLDSFASILQNALKMEGNQNITSDLEFTDAVFDCKNYGCYFENVHTDILNGEKISDWSNHLVFLDSAQFINGTLHADQINATSLHVDGLVDGINIQNLVTKSGYHNITARKTFKDSITAHDIKVSGKVDGVTISSTNVLLTTGHQTVHGNLSFDELQTTWLNAKYVNGINFTKFYDDLVFTEGSFTITGEKSFNDVTINELTMNPGSKINEVDLVDLWKNTLWKNGNQDIKAEVTFSNALIQKNLNVPLGINGIQIPGPRIVDITEPAFVNAPHTFENFTKISHLEIKDSLNGKPLVLAPDGSKQLDIMLKSEDQIITGIKTFQTVHLDADSYVSGTVDGIDLSEFRNSVLRKNTSVEANGTWVFNNLVINGPLSVAGKISGINLKDVYARALKLNDSDIPDMIFKKLVYINDLESYEINGKNLKRDLVLVNEPQRISGNKIFDKIILEENSMVHGLVNNKNLSFLNEIILILGNQTIKSKVFKKNVYIKDLTVTVSINNVSVTDIATLKGGQILGSRVLKNVTFTTIEAKNVEVTGNVNGINLQSMIEDTMTYDGYEAVNGMKELSGTIYVTNDTNLVTNDLNGINLKELFYDAVLINVPQHIEGVKIFKDNVVFDNLFFGATVDGVSEWDMRYDWMLKNAPQTIEGNIKFSNGFSAKELVVGEVNDINMSSLESELVKLNEMMEVEGPIIFENSVMSLGNVSLSGKIQGIDLSEEAVKRGNVIVTGEKIFLNDLVIEGHLTVDGLIDGISVEDLCINSILGKEQNISRLTIKGDVTFMEGGTVGGKIAGVDFRLLNDIAVKSDGTQIQFTGLKTFTNVTFTGPVTMKGKLGGIELEHLVKNYMSLTKNEDITARMHFKETSFEGVLSAQNLNTDNKEINNVHLERLNNMVLKTSGTQTVTATYNIDEVVFDDDVYVSGTVNGLDLPSSLMRHNHTNYIQSPKIFQKSVIIFGDLDMEEGKTIQGVDVSDWYQKAVTRKGKFDIRGYKIFNQLDLNDVTIEGMLDGLKISEDHLLLTYGNQVITGPKVIVGNVTIEGSFNVDGLINGTNLTLLTMETLQRDRNNTVTGLKYFSQPLTIVSLQAQSVAGVDIMKLKGNLNASLNFDWLENRLSEIEGVASHMQIAFDNQAVLFQYYELYDEFGISTAYNWLYVLGKDCGELMLLSDISSSEAQCSSIRIFGFDETSDNFIPVQQEILTSYAISVKSLTFRNATYIFVANQNPHSACSSEDYIGRTTVDVYAWKEGLFRKLQSLPVHQPTDIAAFKEGHLACLVILEHNNSPVYCASEENVQNFTVGKQLHTTGGRKASIIKSSGRIFLAVVAEDISNPRPYAVEGVKYVDIYVWDSQRSAFSVRKQVLQSTSVQSVALMKYTVKNSEMLFLAVAEGILPKIHNDPKIIIYRYENTFVKLQEIVDYGILDWISLKTGELLLFALDTLGGRIKVYQYKGSSGFVKIDTIKSLGTTSIHAFVRSRPEDWFNHYLALAGPHADIVQPSQGVDYAKILKSKVKGRRPFY